MVGSKSFADLCKRRLGPGSTEAQQEQAQEQEQELCAAVLVFESGAVELPVWRSAGSNSSDHSSDESSDESCDDVTGEMRVVTSRAGMVVWRLHMAGVEAHAGNAHAHGRNAIEALCRVVLEVQALTDYSSKLTFNTGTVHA